MNKPVLSLVFFLVAAILGGVVSQVISSMHPNHRGQGEIYDILSFQGYSDDDMAKKLNDKAKDGWKVKMTIPQPNDVIYFVLFKNQ